MRVGTKSVLFGVHAIWIHPFFVAWAWWRLFGFPWDFRLWLAFFLHDAGYIFCPNMDGFEGEQHVVLGGLIMGWMLGRDWRDFTLCHSRHWAKRVGKRYSKLCLADKLAFVLTPAWLYLPMARLSGELQEYMRVASGRQLCGSITDFEQSLLNSRNSRVWLEGLKIYTRRWVEQHRNGIRDRWTVLRSQPQPENAIQAQG
jgi:hypothetical protein